MACSTWKAKTQKQKWIRSVVQVQSTRRANLGKLSNNWGQRWRIKNDNKNGEELTKKAGNLKEQGLARKTRPPRVIKLVGERLIKNRIRFVSGAKSSYHYNVQYQYRSWQSSL